MEALGQLAGGIAHDFNNVLQAVSGGLSLIQKRAADADAVRQLAHMAANAASRGAAITGRLLAFARRGELRAVPVHPLPMLESLQEILASTLGAEISVRIEASPDLPPLLADKAQLETVLINLAVNARDAMPAGGILTLSAQDEAFTTGQGHSAGLHDGPYLRLDLTDTGVGMDVATLTRASEPFFTTKPAGQGTGLGLAMARGFVQQTGGGLSIRSSPGRGTTVTLWFPQAGATGSPDEPMQAQRTATSRMLSARVLLVDDDAMVREVLAGQLEELGYRVAQASDGLAALERLDAGEPVDLLVTDLSMPGMNGLLLINEARRRMPSLPALLLTGYADAGVQFDGEREKTTMLLRKPIIDEELAARAAALLLSR
jgi:CheY-like chemotaxis protein